MLQHRHCLSICVYTSTSIVLEDNEGEGQLSAIIIGHADDTDVRHVRLIKQVAFQFGRRDLKSTHFDELLDAVDDKDLLVLVDYHFVTSVQPSAGVGRLAD